MPNTADSAATENRALEGDRNERRPAVQRLAADVQRVGDRRHPVLQQVAAEAADDAADQHDQRQPGVVRRRALRAALRSETASRRPSAGSPRDRRGASPRRARSDRRTRPSGRRRRRRRRCASHAPAGPRPPSPPAASSRISKIEIIGRKRRNRNSSVRNRPIVPTKVDQSQNVGWYMPHDDGRKSRCRLVTMMTNRSSHMPTLTISEMTNSDGTLVRTRLNHSTCGIDDVAEDQRPVDRRVRAGHPVPDHEAFVACCRCTRR